MTEYRDVVNALMKLNETVGQLSGKIDGISKEQSRVASYTIGTSRRVGRLETRVSGMLGWAAGAAAVVAATVSLVLGLFSTKG